MALPAQDLLRIVQALRQVVDLCHRHLVKDVRFVWAVESVKPVTAKVLIIQKGLVSMN